MPNRRTTLMAMVGGGLSFTALGRVLGAEPSPPGAAPPAAAPPATATPAGTPASAADRALAEDLARMGAHEYSDEGIPVFLACVDLVALLSGQPVAPPTQLSRHVAAELRRYSDAWRGLHPEAPDTDISKIIEVLAARDFAAGGQGGAS